MRGEKMRKKKIIVENQNGCCLFFLPPRGPSFLSSFPPSKQALQF